MEPLVPLEFTLVVERLFHTWMGNLRRSDRGQDLAEYCLLTAAIALVGLGIFIYLSGGLQSLWNGFNGTVAAGSSNVASGTPTGSAADH